MSENNFYKPEEIKPLYGEIVPAYQAAFAGEPWYEVSKCADEQLRCVGGLSTLAIGSMCDTCTKCPSRPAYEADELVERFDAVAASRPTAWYAEQNEDGLTMAAVAWKATPSVIAEEKYSDVPIMNNWLRSRFSSPIERLARRLTTRPGEAHIMWLDEVFANKQLKAKGNLQSFGKFVIGLAEMLNCEIVAYRTIEPRMTGVAKRDFGNDAIVLERGEKVPDRRDFVIINTMDLVDDGAAMCPSEGVTQGVQYTKVRKLR